MSHSAELYNELKRKIEEYQNIVDLPGIITPIKKDVFIKQIIDSIRRVSYISVITSRDIHVNRTLPSSGIFDPIKAACWHMSNGNIDESFWLVFLITHFGKNKRTSWNLIKNIYGELGSGNIWSWQRITQDINSFKNWLHESEVEVKINAKFGNHRKYVSISAYNNNGTGDTISSYIDWIGNNFSHEDFIRNKIEESSNNPQELFNYLYKSINNVKGFGRLAKFDYLTMIGKIGLVNIEPDSPYFSSATGPKDGTKRLYGIYNESNSVMNNWIIDFGRHLNLYFGMQVLEDAICNWNKSPSNYIYFNG